MEKIGEKIKRVREEKGLTQSNIHENNSKVSQIESGRNRNPSVETLQIMARGLEISFEELIDNTDWENSRSTNNSSLLAFAPLDFEVTLDNNGSIFVEHQSYPMIDSRGEENKYCPKSGSALISKCSHCKKPLIDSKNIFCMGCGERTFFKYTSNIDEWVYSTYEGAFYFVKDKNDDDYLNLLIKEIGELDPWHKMGDITLSPEGIKLALGMQKLGNPEYEHIDKTLDHCFSILKAEGADFPHPIDFDEYCKGYRSKNEEIASHCLKNTFQEMFYQKVIIEIKKLFVDKKNIVENS